MSDDLDTALKLNGVWGKRPIRELAEFNLLYTQHIERPTRFVDGIAIVSRWLSRDGFVLLFLECEPDAFYALFPNEDSRRQRDD